VVCSRPSDVHHIKQNKKRKKKPVSKQKKRPSFTAEEHAMKRLSNFDDLPRVNESWPLPASFDVHFG
jgi:hypothetical protein